MDYESDVRIDESALDIECLEQPNLMMKYALLAAEADKEVDLAKEALDLIDAELDTVIRTSPERYEITKLTEAVVANTILQQDEHKRATRRVIDAKFNAKIASGAVKAIDAKKSMLETLVKLHGQQYFAGPSVPRDITNEVQQKRTNVRIARTMKRKNRDE